MTTRANAAVDTALPQDRRTLLTGAALASIITATAAVPAIADGMPGPIETAYGEWHKAARAADTACEATWEAEKLYEAPERPRYNHMRSRGGYDLDIIDAKVRPITGRTYLKLDDENVQRLKDMIAESFDPSKSDPESVQWDRRSHEQTIVEARETLEAIEAHRAECKRRADACGLTAAKEHERPLLDASEAARDACLAMTPTTFREAAFQAALLCEYWDEAATSRLNRALADLAGIPSYFAEA